MKIDDKCRLKEILTKTLIQGLMDSNLVSYETWLNSSEVFYFFMIRNSSSYFLSKIGFIWFKVYNSQEQNVVKIKECLEVLKAKNTSEAVLIDSANYEKILQEHQSFDKFVERFDFSTFLQKLGIQAFQDDKHKSESSDEDDEFTQILTALSNAVADPKAIDIIAENLVKSV
jgi:hypothetical protein